ncbi:hypothetical protein C8R43DRAFT_1115930 [Mycena crocata]|nr:hypothetical protein C8R43DRAFT_1115930 [Mycena crocata]
MPLGADSRRSTSDQALLDGLSGRDVMEFRNFIYSPAYIRANAGLFLDNDWIIISELADWLHTRNPVPVPVSTRPVTPPRPAHIKQEIFDLSDSPTRLIRENGREVVEIMSDSEDGEPADPAQDSDFEVSETLFRGASRSSSLPAFDSDYIKPYEDADNGPVLEESDTLWQDANLTSQVIVGTFRITSHVTVERLEFVNQMPSIWPILETPTAFVLTLDSTYTKIDPKTGQTYTMDWLIKKPREEPIRCRRARMTCNGCGACERRDRKLIEINRYDLDPASRNAVLEAQQDTRRRAGVTAEDHTAGFYDVVMRKGCVAIDRSGKKCTGKPHLRLKPRSVAPGGSRAHLYWVGCNGWRKDFKDDHRTFTIPDYVDEPMLIRLFDTGRIADDDSRDTPACSCIVTPRTGLGQKYCPHTHVVNGIPEPLSVIKRYDCPAVRTIFVPLDTSIRRPVIVHQRGTPHRHPMPPLTKVSLDIKEKYRACVAAAGPVGATVSKVDHAQSTKLLLGGQTPALFAPALGNNRVKRGIVHGVKAKKYPAGLGVPGATQLYLDDLKNPPDKRYIHCCRTTPDGGILIITGVPFLIKLLDDPGVRAFEDDTTFKRIHGEMNEWELAFYLAAIQRASTAIRAYINRASTDFFEILFDELQEIKRKITGKVLGMKVFVRGGNLLVMNADMEAAQILGAARSIMKTNEPEYSGIPNYTPPAVAATVPSLASIEPTSSQRHVGSSWLDPLEAGSSPARAQYTIQRH